jgi:hypothetical protein
MTTADVDEAFAARFAEQFADTCESFQRLLVLVPTCTPTFIVVRIGSQLFRR